MGKSDALKSGLSNNKTTLGMVLVGIVAAGSLARSKQRGKAKATGPDMSKFPADE